MTSFVLAAIAACILWMAGPAAAATVDLIEVTGFSFYSPGNTFLFLGGSHTYMLSDGSSWMSGAGSFQYATGTLQSVVSSGNRLRYTFTPPSDTIFYRYTDYDSGAHSSQGELGVTGPTVLEAATGSTTAVLSGYLKILSNERTGSGQSQFHPFSADVGSLVQYSIRYTLNSGTWTENLFQNGFSYTFSGHINFTSARGDIDCDGDVDLQDAIIALKLVSGVPLPVPVLPAGDVDRDHKIGLPEAIYALQHLARLRNNHVPVLESIGNRTIGEGKTLSFTLSATDADGDILNYSASGLPSGALLDVRTGAFTWTPSHAQSGQYPVAFTVRDDFGGQASETITITVDDIPVLYASSEYYPLHTGNWIDYISNLSGTIVRSSVPRTTWIRGVETWVQSDWTGIENYYTSDSGGIRHYGQYDPEFNVEIIFDDPLLLMPNTPVIGIPQVSSSQYAVTYWGVPLHVSITSTIDIIGVEDVQTKNGLLKDCIKISVRDDQWIVESGQYVPGETSYLWFYKDVGIVKQVTGSDLYTIDASFIGGVLRRY